MHLDLRKPWSSDHQVSGWQEYKNPLLRNALEPSTAEACGERSCSRRWDVQNPAQSTGCVSSNNALLSSRLDRYDREPAAEQGLTIPYRLALIDPERFSPSARPSEELLRLGAAFAEDRNRFDNERQEHARLVSLLTPQDWKLLRWSDPRLIKLAAQEHLGPASLDTAASNPRLRNLLQRRQRAWIRAHGIVKQWQRLVLHRGFLGCSFRKLWPTWRVTDHIAVILDTSPDCACKEAYVDALGMVPNAPEFLALYQDLPRWAKAEEAGSAKLTAKGTCSLQ